MTGIFDSAYYFGRKNSNYRNYEIFRWRIMWFPILRLIKKYANGGHFLDVGCAFGYLVNFASQFFMEAVGVDISSFAVQRAQKNFPKLHFQRGDIVAGLPFRNEQFDFITAVDVLEHTIAPERAVQEISRLLKCGGYLYVRLPYDGLLRKVLGRFDRDKTHISIFTPQAWKSLLARNKLEVKKEKRFPSLIGGQLTLFAQRTC